MCITSFRPISLAFKIHPGGDFFSEMSELISAVYCDSLGEVNALCGKLSAACLKLSLKYKRYKVLVRFCSFSSQLTFKI